SLATEPRQPARARKGRLPPVWAPAAALLREWPLASCVARRDSPGRLGTSPARVMYGPVVAGDRVRPAPPRLEYAPTYMRWFADRAVTRYMRPVIRRR